VKDLASNTELDDGTVTAGAVGLSVIGVGNEDPPMGVGDCADLHGRKEDAGPQKPNADSGPIAD